VGDFPKPPNPVKPDVEANPELLAGIEEPPKPVNGVDADAELVAGMDVPPNPPNAVEVDGGANPELVAGVGVLLAAHDCCVFAWEKGVESAAEEKGLETGAEEKLGEVPDVIEKGLEAGAEDCGCEPPKEKIGEDAAGAGAACCGGCPKLKSEELPEVEPF
jgi:hypothetical protein